MSPSTLSGAANWKGTKAELVTKLVEHSVSQHREAVATQVDGEEEEQSDDAEQEGPAKRGRNLTETKKGQHALTAALGEKEAEVLASQDQSQSTPKEAKSVTLPSSSRSSYLVDFADLKAKHPHVRSSEEVLG